MSNDKNTSYYQDLRDMYGELTPLTLSAIEQSISQYYASMPDSNIEGDEFVVRPLEDDEIAELIAKEHSPYNKILPGYMYKVYGVGLVCTGRGGAQMLYKAMLRQGMSEEMISNTIMVKMDDGAEYPLSLLTVKKR